MIVRVHLAWVDGDRAIEQTLDLERPFELAGSVDGWPTIQDVLACERVESLLPKALLAGPLGVSSWGRRRRLDDLVQPGDRIELCPPLQADPKEARRARVDERRQGLRRDRWHTPRQP